MQLSLYFKHLKGRSGLINRTGWDSTQPGTDERKFPVPRPRIFIYRSYWINATQFLCPILASQTTKHVFKSPNSNISDWGNHPWMLPSCDNCKRSGCAYLHVTIAFDDDQKKASKSFHVLVASQSLLYNIL